MAGKQSANQSDQGEVQLPKDTNVMETIPLEDGLGSQADELEVEWKSITVDDLINFAYQCASGMNYLASRKVCVHLRRFWFALYSCQGHSP